MSNNKRNFVIAYIFLVALPVGGLMSVLKHGRGLTAPVSVDGVWKLEADSSRLAALPCGKSLASTPYATITISQSGKNFTLDLANGLRTKASGSVDGTALTASISPSAQLSNEAGCGSDRVLSLVASVDPKANPRSLTGTLSANDCPSCTSVEFHAVRQNSIAKKEGH